MPGPNDPITDYIISRDGTVTFFAGGQPVVRAPANAPAAVDKIRRINMVRGGAPVVGPGPSGVTYEGEAPQSMIDLSGVHNERQGRETTALSPEQEAKFQAWARALRLGNVDHPDQKYDYRGAFLSGFKPDKTGHWPDLYKQKGHPTFSVESQYAKGPSDAGHWEGDTFVPAVPEQLPAGPLPAPGFQPPAPPPEHNEAQAREERERLRQILAAQGQSQ